MMATNLMNRPVRSATRCVAAIHRGIVLAIVPIFFATTAWTVDPAEVGQWSAVQTWPAVAVHAQLLPTGDVLLWSNYTNGAGAQIWRPATNTFTQKSYSAANLFCGGHAYLADGRLLVAGGIVGPNHDLGPYETTIFNPQSETWSPGPLMSAGRYYPTTTTLADGRVLVQGGTTVCNACVADLPEIYDPITNVWTPMAESARKAFKYYPHTYLLPDGRILVAAQDDRAIATQALDLNTQTWTTIDPGIIDGHSSVMYRPGKIMKAGKATADNPGLPAAATTYDLDMTQPSPSWQATAWMAFPRSHLNLTVLPDGQVLATGGATTTDLANFATAVYEAEMWSPTTKTWTTMSPGQVPRLYHSIALLLPDARVLVAGGGRQNCAIPCPVPSPGDQQNAEIFSPPYLFKGPRPVISSAPSVLPYNATFAVATPDAARISSVSLIALGAVTHAFNENQRFVPLTFTQAGGSLSVTGPINGYTAPPGPYMLFLVDDLGVPSVAAMVRLPVPGADSQSPTAPSSLLASVSTGRADLTWGAASDNVGVTGYDVHRSTTSGFVPGFANRIGQTVATAYSDQGLSSGTYHYVVVARDAAGNPSPPSNQASATVVADTTPPGTPTELSVAFVGPGQISLSWKPATDDVGVKDYLLDRCTGSGCTGFAQVGKSTGTLFDDLGLTAGTTYRYRARAEDARGNLGASSDIVSGATTGVSGGLVAAWGFNEGTGGTAADVSGLVNTGALGGATWTVEGKFGGALSFDGSTSQVTVADAASLDLTSGLTVEAWVKPSVAPVGWRSVIAKDVDRYYLMASTSNQNRPGFGGTFGSTNQNVFGTATLPIPPSPWAHLAATYDRVTIRLYVNGVQVDSAAQTDPLSTSTSALTIGADFYGEFFQGALDEIRIYNRALSVSEIQKDMNTPAQGGVVQVSVGRELQTGSVVLSWVDSALAGTYRVRRATGPTPAAFSNASCWIVQGTSFTDPAPLNNGISYDYLVDAGSSCP